MPQPAFVQTASGSDTTAPLNPVTASLTPTVGNTLIAFGFSNDVAAQTCVLSDDQGNSWVDDQAFNSGNSRNIFVRHAYGVVGAATVVTATFSDTSATAAVLRVAEFQGILSILPYETGDYDNVFSKPWYTATASGASQCLVTRQSVVVAAIHTGEDPANNNLFLDSASGFTQIGGIVAGGIVISTLIGYKIVGPVGQQNMIANGKTGGAAPRQLGVTVAYQSETPQPGALLSPQIEAGRGANR